MSKVNLAAMSADERRAAPTPPFFKRKQRLGRKLLAVGAGLGSLALLLAAPPIGLAAVAAYVGAAGGAAVAVGKTMVEMAKLTVDKDALESEMQKEDSF